MLLNWEKERRSHHMLLHSSEAIVKACWLTLVLETISVAVIGLQDRKPSHKVLVLM